MEYREELKFLCSDYELALIRHRLNAVMQPDAHQTDDCYHIRSVYFDTINDDCFHENEAGIDERKKYRIRIYNCSDSKISFEIKEKKHAKTKKTSFPITRELCDSILNGDTLPPAADASAAKQQVFLKEHLQLLRPRVIVDYERTAFVHPIGNVRITLDRNIAGSYRLNDFFNPDLMLIPVLEPHMHVLEVKYDELLPDFIAQAIEINTLRHTSFSKYYLCRQSSNLIYDF